MSGKVGAAARVTGCTQARRGGSQQVGKGGTAVRMESCFATQVWMERAVTHVNMHAYLFMHLTMCMRTP
eukprot:365350-Chlamydomonas_euryale.AAC.2